VAGVRNLTIAATWLRQATSWEREEDVELAAVGFVPPPGRLGEVTLPLVLLGGAIRGVRRLIMNRLGNSGGSLLEKSAKRPMVVE